MPSKGTKDVRVLPNGGRGHWRVTVNGRTVSHHRLKERAVGRGVKEGHKSGPAELRVHRLDGTVQRGGLSGPVLRLRGERFPAL